PTPWISATRTVIGGGVSDRLRVGRNACADAELIVDATAERAAGGPVSFGQLAPGGGAPGPGGGPGGGGGGGLATVTGFGLGGGAFFLVGVRLGVGLALGLAVGVGSAVADGGSV